MSDDRASFTETQGFPAQKSAMLPASRRPAVVGSAGAARGNEQSAAEADDGPPPDSVTTDPDVLISEPLAVTSLDHDSQNRTSRSPRIRDSAARLPEPGIDRACYLYGHKSAGGILRWSGEVIALVGEMGGAPTQQRRPVKRGTITEWSLRSRRRLVKTVLASEAATWGRAGDATQVLLVTLTYPGQDGRGCIPHDGRVAHAHCAGFLEHWKRRFQDCRGVWKLEFQARAGEWANDWERCAPHWTIWMAAPAGALLPEIQEWVSATWWRIVGSGARSHLLAGTRVEPWYGSLVGYALKYMRKGRDKEYQHRVPDGYVNPGRWWGLVDLPVRWTEAPLSERQFYTLRRLLIKARQRVRTGRAPLKVLSRYAGLWMWTRRDRMARTAEMVAMLMRGTRLAIEGRRGREDGLGNVPRAASRRRDRHRVDDERAQLGPGR